MQHTGITTFFQTTNNANRISTMVDIKNKLKCNSSCYLFFLELVDLVVSVLLQNYGYFLIYQLLYFIMRLTRR